MMIFFTVITLKALILPVQRGVWHKIERMVENRDIFDFTLDEQDLAQIATLNRDEIIFNHRALKRWAEHRG